MNLEAMLRNVLQAVETRNAALLKAEQDYSAALRQIIAKGFREPEPAAAIEPAEVQP